MEIFATPTKSSKRGRKKDGGCNDRCRFCSCSFENSGTRASFENLFSKSARKDSPGTVLADCCSSMGFPLIKSQSVSERVCRSCGRKIRNASELYRFIQTAVTCSNDSATGNETEESNLQECSSKRELPTTVTPNRKIKRDYCLSLQHITQRYKTLKRRRWRSVSKNPESSSLKLKFMF